MKYFLLVNLVEKSMHIGGAGVEEGGQELTQNPSYKRYPELQEVQTSLVLS